METLLFAVLAAFVFGYGLVSRRLESTPVTAPMVFTLLGLGMGMTVISGVSLDVEHRGIHLLAEVTLALILFTDASRIKLQALRKGFQIPLRLLGLGLPLTVVLGALAALVLLDQMNVWEAALLAAILAPTDAALGQAVVNNPRVPQRIRQALNVESGLNDGLALPLVLILLSFAGAAEAAHAWPYWVRFVAQQVAGGVVLGAGIGWAGGHLVAWATRKQWINGAFERLAALALALLTFALVETAGGNGFIGTFCGGIALGNLRQPVSEVLHEFGEAEGQLLTLLTFFIFGAVMVPPALARFDGGMLAYAVLSLTLVRMLPVALSLLGLGLTRNSVLFLGWFGPRGLASILFALLVLEEVPIAQHDPICDVVTFTVLLSVFAHGMTAAPAARAYAHHAADMQAEARPEWETVAALPARFPMADAEPAL